MNNILLLILLAVMIYIIKVAYDKRYKTLDEKTTDEEIRRLKDKKKQLKKEEQLEKLRRETEPNIIDKIKEHL